MLRRLEKRTLRVQDTLAILNLGQGLIISAGLFAVMALACQDIVAGTLMHMYVHVGVRVGIFRCKCDSHVHVNVVDICFFCFADRCADSW